MASIDDVIMRLTTVRESLNRASEEVAHAAELSREVQDQLVAMGAYGVAERLTPVLDAIEEATARLAAGIAMTDEAIARALAAKGGAYSSGVGVPGPGSPSPAPVATRTSSSYPVARPHTVSWSDLHHVCHGDPDDEEKGGHLHGTRRPGKTEFPPDWDDEKVAEALTAVADRPSDVQERPNGTWYATATHDGVTLTSVVRVDGSIAAGWPRSGPGVRRNPPRIG